MSWPLSARTGMKKEQHQDVFVGGDVVVFVIAIGNLVTMVLVLVLWWYRCCVGVNVSVNGGDS